MQHCLPLNNGSISYVRLTGTFERGANIWDDKVTCRNKSFPNSAKEKRGRLWLNDGSCIRLRPEHKNHVWSYDFVMTRTYNSKPVRMLNVLDEYTRESLCIKVAWKIAARDVLEELF